MRVKPSPLITVGLTVGYMAIVAGAWAVGGLDYDAVGESTSTVVKGIVIPVALGAVFLAVATSYLGWWGPAIREELRAPTWLWAVPAVMVLPGLGALLGGLGPAGRAGNVPPRPRRRHPARRVQRGVSTRGTGLVGLRGGFGEALSWFFSCLIFGLIHAVNVFFGQAIGTTVQQIVFAFLAGTVFYMTRRVSGTLIVCMLLHAWIDFTTFAFSDAATKAESPFLVLGFAQWIAFILAIVGVVMVLRRGSSQGQPTSEAVAAA